MFIAKKQLTNKLWKDQPAIQGDSIHSEMSNYVGNNQK